MIYTILKLEAEHDFINDRKNCVDGFDYITGFNTLEDARAHISTLYCDGCKEDVANKIPFIPCTTLFVIIKNENLLSCKSW